MEKRRKPLPMETLPRDELEKLQNRRLRYTLREAYEHTLFWHEKFDSLGIKPEDIKNKEDLEKAYEKGLKVTKEDLIKEFDKLLPDYVKENRIFFEEMWTSGFGGVPKRIIVTKDTYKLIKETGNYLLNSMNLRKGDRVLSLLAPSPYSSGKQSREVLKDYPIWLLEIAVPIPPAHLLNILRFFRPTHLWGLSSKIEEIGYKISELGVNPSSLGIEKILVSGESTTKAGRKRIEEKWGAEVFDTLGSTECGIWGYECEYHNYLHVPETRVLLSVTHPKTDEIVGVNEEGKDLITTLYEENEIPGMFLINYSHGDLLKLINEKCECGRTFQKIDYPRREDEVINIAGVKLYVRDIEGAPIRNYIVVSEYNREKRKHILEIRVVPQKNIEDKEIEDLVLYHLFSSNPAALELIREKSDIKVKIYDESKLYKDLNISCV